MTTDTPIADRTAAELSKLLSLGFSDHQARTLIISANITESNASKAPKPTPSTTPIPGWAVDADFTAVTPEPRPVGLIDKDGDLWNHIEGTDLWRCVDIPGVEHRTQAALNNSFGPLTQEVVAQ